MTDTLRTQHINQLQKIEALIHIQKKGIPDKSVSSLNNELIKALIEQKRAEAELLRRLEFETLAASLCQEFIHVTTDQMDELINMTLARIGRFIDGDRAYVFLYKDNHRLMDNTHEWCNDGIDPYIHHLQNLKVDDYYVVKRVIQSQRYFQLSHLDELPPEALVDRQDFERQGIQSLFLTPLICKTSHLGFLGIDAVRAPKTWSSGTIALISMVAQAIANAITRQRAEEALYIKQFCLDTSNLSVFWVQQNGQFAYVNDKACESLGYTQDELHRLGLWDIDPNYRVKDNQLWWKLVHRSEKGLVFERTHKTKDGRVFPVEICAKSMSYRDLEVNVCFVRDITERKQTQERLMEYQTKLKAMGREVSNAEERFKRRIGEQLHDQIGQSLAFSKMKLQVLASSTLNEGIQGDLQVVCQTLTQSISDIRTLTFELASPILPVLGLEKTVRAWLRDHVEQKHAIATKFVDDGQSKPLDEDMQAMLFRCIRELLVNVIKHAEASLITVSISRHDNYIHICVEDNGKGLSPDRLDETSSEAGFGLFSIRERLAHFQGTLQIDSCPGQGCKAYLIAPLGG